GRRRPCTVVAGSTEAGQRTHPFNCEFALRLAGRHRFDDAVDRSAPSPSLGRRATLTCRKACRKKSSSTCCWPILRSNSAIRFLVPSTGEAACFAVMLRATIADSALGGRPRPRSASGPPDRKRLRQTYRSLRRTLSSRASALTFSPASMRRTILSLNSRVKTRIAFLDMGSPWRNCPHYPCLTLGVHSTTPTPFLQFES